MFMQHLLLGRLPLLGGIAFGSPCVDGSDFLLQRCVYKTVTGEHCLSGELLRNNYGLECLAAATY
jgi:hypothetical protein